MRNKVKRHFREKFVEQGFNSQMAKFLSACSRHNSFINHMQEPSGVSK